MLRDECKTSERVVTRAEKWSTNVVVNPCNPYYYTHWSSNSLPGGRKSKRVWQTSRKAPWQSGEETQRGRRHADPEQVVCTASTSATSATLQQTLSLADGTRLSGVGFSQAAMTWKIGNTQWPPSSQLLGGPQCEQNRKMSSTVMIWFECGRECPVQTAKLQISRQVCIR